MLRARRESRANVAATNSTTNDGGSSRVYPRGIGFKSSRAAVASRWMSCASFVASAVSAWVRESCSDSRLMRSKRAASSVASSKGITARDDSQQGNKEPSQPLDVTCAPRYAHRRLDAEKTTLSASGGHGSGRRAARPISRRPRPAVRMVPYATPLPDHQAVQRPPRNRKDCYRRGGVRARRDGAVRESTPATRSSVWR